MSSETVAAGHPVGAEPAVTPESTRLQILATEHWSLLASRALAWNEAFSRAGMFLTTLSGAVVALALVAQALDFGRSFVWFALAILPIVLYVGLATYLRLGTSNYHDAQCVIGMNRIRAAYLEIAPDLERYFVMSAHDDLRGLGVTMGVDPDRRTAVHLISATPSVVAILDAVVAGVIGALLAHQLDGSTGVTVAAGVTSFGLVLAGLTWYGLRLVARQQTAHQALFPSPK